MTPKTILVCLTTVESAATLMAAAVPLARRSDAHLIGLVTLEALIVYPGIAMHIPETAFTTFHANQKAEAQAMRTIFEDHTRAEDFVSEFRMVKAEAQSASERMVESARAADLVIMGQEDRATDRYDQRQAQTHVIKGSGRPVIVVPLDYTGPEIGQSIVLGWSDTREAARAAHDMLAIARPGAAVRVLRVGAPRQDAFADADAIDLTAMLARHGLKPTLEYREAGRGGIAEVLNAAAFETGADLIVTGAFGHSRAYDFVLGATSHALLRDQKCPVLFSK